MEETNLDIYRKSIDEIDEQLAALFQKRFELVSGILDYKLEHHLPILDEKREEVIIAKNGSRIADEDISDRYVLLFRYLLELSKDYQEELLRRK